MSEPHESIQSILSAHWNPLRLEDSEEAAKAYQAYARQAQSMLEQRRSEKDIAAYLHEVATELTGTPELSYEISVAVAARIKALRS